MSGKKVDINEYKYKDMYERFTKEDVSKIWSNWEQVPYDAVKGASTTYATFMKGIVSRSFVPDEIYYKKTIALLIIYKFLMSRPECKNYTNGKATVAAYTMAILNYLTMGRFDLLKIWQEQELSDNTKVYLNKLSDEVFDRLNTQANCQSTTVLSFGKTKAAYESIKTQPFNADIHLLDNELVKQ